VAIEAAVSTPDDRAGIKSLMMDALELPGDSCILDADYLDWKYWRGHPFNASSRSRILKKDGAVVAHGCLWPLRLIAGGAQFDAFHLIDWAANRNLPGTGIRVLRYCSAGQAAVLSIGGSEMTRQILPMFGFKPYNKLVFLWRPLRPVESVFWDEPAKWKTPLRIMRNIGWCLSSSGRLPNDCEVITGGPGVVPDSLWMKPIPDQAISLRSAELLAHMPACPLFESPLFAVLKRRGMPLGYIMLVRRVHEVRLADYGPPGLDEESAMLLGTAAQSLARTHFHDVPTLAAMTSESSVQAGWIRAGLHVGSKETINVLKLTPQMDPIQAFRLTMIDTDAVSNYP